MSRKNSISFGILFIIIIYIHTDTQTHTYYNDANRKKIYNS